MFISYQGNNEIVTSFNNLLLRIFLYKSDDDQLGSKHVVTSAVKQEVKFSNKI